MGERSGYYFDVNAWRNSRKVRKMNHEARALYREVMDEIWLHGSIPSKVEEIAELAKTPLETVIRCWPQVHECLTPMKHNPDELTSARMEEERRRRNKVKKLRAKWGKLGGEASGEKRRSKSEAIASQNEPTQDKTRQVQDKSLLAAKAADADQSPPPKENSATPRDEAADIFSALYLAKYGVPYRWRKGDFVQMADLRKLLDIGGKETPEGWKAAGENYLSTPKAMHTMAELATEYATFKNHALDRFGKPVRNALAAKASLVL